VPPADVNEYQYIKDIYQRLRQSKSDRTGVYDIPDTACKDRVFLEGNDLFFVWHILIEKNHDRVDCDPLFRHLNDCFSCFQIYSQFLKGYYQGRQDINERIKEI
jgi:hypothetical protein